MKGNEIPLSSGNEVKIHPELIAKIVQINGYQMYKYATLRDVWEQVDIDPANYDFIDLDEVLEDIGEDDYDAVLDRDLGGGALNIIEFVIDKLNKEVLKDISEDGLNEEGATIYDSIYFDGDNNEGNFKLLKKLESIFNDKELQKVIKAKEWEGNEDVFYVFQYHTYVVE